MKKLITTILATIAAAITTHAQTWDGPAFVVSEPDTLTLFLVGGLVLAGTCMYNYRLREK